MDERIQKYEEKMKKTLGSLEAELTTIRAGRANPHILDKLTVDYYGSPTPIQQVANITVPEARMIQIQPWESSLIKGIEKAILTSDLGLNPNNDGKVIRLVFPELTEERRKDLAKDVKKKGEGAKVAVRNIRRDANDLLKKLEKGGEITEDELADGEDQIQKLTDKMIAKVDKAVEENNVKKMRRAEFWYPLFASVPLRIIPTFLALLLGVDAVSAFLDAIPAWATNGLSVAGGLLPALGFAVTIMVIGKKNLIPYFIIGFALVAYSGMNTIGVAVLAICIALLQGNFVHSDEQAPQTVYADDADDLEGDI